MNDTDGTPALPGGGHDAREAVVAEARRNYYAGVEAKLGGVPATGCPHPQGTTAYRQWMAGHGETGV
jgi:hypothetical protein